ncbi:MAG: hypothetical protein GKR93_01690 [Gammaproteobacteria bacterium]|nr:hypothetical protein [Gammaproteobacteria bacterium]
MENQKTKYGFIGIGLGSIALLTALFHFYAGPFSPQPSVEDIVADKAVAIRDATIAALKGEERERKSVVSEYDLDDGTQIAIALLGGLAVIFGIIGYAKKEPIRVAGGAAVLGGGAIAFQFLTIALGVLVLVILIGVVLSQIGIG